MNIITGYRGEPHITSGQNRAQNQGTYGTGSYILDVGQQLAAEIVSANEIRIRDGALSHQGCIANIEQGAYDSLEITNGTQGMSRIDLIVARYTKDAETNVEDIELVVIEGTAAASSPAVPSYNTGDIQAGDSPVDMPLYRVNISGVNIGSVTQVAATVRTQAETDALLGNTSISGIGGGTLTGAVSALNSKIGNTAMGTTATTLTGAIAEHNSKLDGIIIQKTYDKAYTIDAEARLNILGNEMGYSTPSGYTLLGIISFSSGHGDVTISSINASAQNTNGLSLRNNAKTAISATARIVVAYIKSALL